MKKIHCLIAIISETSMIPNANIYSRYHQIQILLVLKNSYNERFPENCISLKYDIVSRLPKNNNYLVNCLKYHVYSWRYT